MIIDKPWAIVYAPKSKLGKGLVYGLGLTRVEAWKHASLVWFGESGHDLRNTGEAKRFGLMAKRVEINLP